MCRTHLLDLCSSNLKATMVDILQLCSTVAPLSLIPRRVHPFNMFCVHAACLLHNTSGLPPQQPKPTSSSNGSNGLDPVTAFRAHPTSSSHPSPPARIHFGALFIELASALASISTEQVRFLVCVWLLLLLQLLLVVCSVETCR